MKGLEFQKRREDSRRNLRTHGRECRGTSTCCSNFHPRSLRDWRQEKLVFRPSLDPGTKPHLANGPLCDDELSNTPGKEW